MNYKRNQRNYTYNLHGCLKDMDEETGLYYYGMRYYAAWLCRFINVDPLQFKYPYYTPFQYAGNKPITYTDLDGGEPDKKTGHINATFYFTFEVELGLTPEEQQEYIDKFKTNVRDTWNSYTYRGMSVNVDEVEFVFANGKTEKNLGSYEFLITVGNGSTADADSIPNRSYVKGNTGYMYYDSKNLASEAAHEFGHFFGLVDRYINLLKYGKIFGSKKNDFPIFEEYLTLPLYLPNAEQDYDPLTNMYSSPNHKGGTLTQNQLDIIFSKKQESTISVPVLIVDKSYDLSQMVEVTFKNFEFKVRGFKYVNGVAKPDGISYAWAFKFGPFEKSKNVRSTYFTCGKRSPHNSNMTVGQDNWNQVKIRSRLF